MKERGNSRVIWYLVVLGLCAFVITYCFRSWQLENYMESLGNAVDSVEEEPEFDITALKIGFSGSTYTLDEFVALEEIPVVVDVLIMQDNGELVNKPAYVSYDTEDSDDIQYIDGQYGRLILPAKYNKGVG